MIITAAAELQNMIPNHGEGQGFCYYWQVIQTHCLDDNIAYLAEALWWGHKTGRTNILETATFNEACEFLVKYRHLASVHDYEDVLSLPDLQSEVCTYEYILDKVQTEHGK